MAPLTQDIIVVVSAVGGIVGIVYATYQHFKSGSKYIESGECEKHHIEIKKQLAKLENQRIKEDAILHEKINAVSNRLSHLEGRLDK